MISNQLRLGNRRTYLRGPGISFDYSMSINFVFFFGLSASPAVRDLFIFGLGELVAPVDDWGAVFVGLEVLAGTAGPSTPEGRKKAVPGIEEDCLKSVPTPVMSKIRFFASLEGSLLDFLDCLAVMPVDDIECGRLFLVCSVAS